MNTEGQKVYIVWLWYGYKREKEKKENAQRKGLLEFAAYKVTTNKSVS